MTTPIDDRVHDQPCHANAAQRDDAFDAAIQRTLTDSAEACPAPIQARLDQMRHRAVQSATHPLAKHHGLKQGVRYALPMLAAALALLMIWPVSQDVGLSPASSPVPYASHTSHADSQQALDSETLWLQVTEWVNRDSAGARDSTGAHESTRVTATFNMDEALELVEQDLAFYHWLAQHDTQG